MTRRAISRSSSGSRSVISSQIDDRLVVGNELVGVERALHLHDGVGTGTPRHEKRERDREHRKQDATKSANATQLAVLRKHRRARNLRSREQRIARRLIMRTD